MTQARDIVSNLGIERHVSSIGLHVLGNIATVTASYTDKLNGGNMRIVSTSTIMVGEAGELVSTLIISKSDTVKPVHGAYVAADQGGHPFPVKRLS